MVTSVAVKNSKIDAGAGLERNRRSCGPCLPPAGRHLFHSMPCELRGSQAMGWGQAILLAA